ncbi:hypothetical protein CQA18_25655, partial [Enterobacter hormaechei]
WVVLDSIAVDLTFLKMPGPGDRAFPFLTSDNHGGGLQRKTVTSILMAWVFTLPAAIFLSGGLYWIALQLI